MQVSIENISTLERKVTVGIPAEKIESAMASRINEVTKTVKLDGFRPGKVPVKVVKKRFGAAIRSEVIEKAIQETIFEALNQEKISPAGMPSIESINDEEGKDVEFVAKLEVYPEINLAEFSNISIEQRESEITDKDFDERLEQMRERAKEWVEVERKAKEGDQVIIDYKGSKNGEAFEGGSAEDSPLELGSGSMIAGFEEGIVGMKAGDEKDLDLSFPEDYHAEDLKGQAVVFNIKLKTVNESKLPELDDEFGKKMGVDGGLEEFKKQVRESMDRELEQALKGDVKQQVMDELLRLHEIDVPQAIVGQQIQVMKQQMLQQFGGAQIDTSMFPDEMFADRAKENAALSLVLSKVIESRQLTATREAVKEYIEKMAEQYGEQKDEIVKYYLNDKQRHAEIEAVVLEEQLVDLVLEEAKVSNAKLDFADAISPRVKEEA
jgi:trigger factor